MSTVTDIGVRVELVPMDSHFHEISVALYRQDRSEGPVGLLHTYSSKAGADGRIAFLARAMTVLGGLEPVEGSDRLVRFPCGGWHSAAAKRLFLEACKLDSASSPAPRPLEIVDRKTGQTIQAQPLGEGSYRVLADGVTDAAPSRAPAVAHGLAKLGELTVKGDDATAVSFPCHSNHHDLIGLLLVRALNVRAALREEELTSSRGVLSAPSAQETPS